MTKHSVYKSTLRKSKSPADAVRVKQHHENRTSTIQTITHHWQRNDKYEQEADGVAEQVVLSKHNTILQVEAAPGVET